MPDLRLERVARNHVYTLRHEEPGIDEVGTDRYLLGPILERLNAAVADLLEYHLDASGGHDGIAATVARLAHLAESIPDKVPAPKVRPS